MCSSRVAVGAIRFEPCTLVDEVAATLELTVLRCPVSRDCKKVCTVGTV